MSSSSSSYDLFETVFQVVVVVRNGLQQAIIIQEEYNVQHRQGRYIKSIREDAQQRLMCDYFDEHAIKYYFGLDLNKNDP